MGFGNFAERLRLLPLPELCDESIIIQQCRKGPQRGVKSCHNENVEPQARGQAKHSDHRQQIALHDKTGAQACPTRFVVAGGLSAV